MSDIFFTSDCHFNHSGIILPTKRPWFNKSDVQYNEKIEQLEWISKSIAKQRTEEMNNALINNWNKKVKKTDLIYHIGDFSFKGQEQCRLFESKLNGKIVHILGNHDSNNGVKSVITKAILEFGKKVILVTHVPPHFSLEIPEWCDMVLCGHVHNNWKYKFIDDTPVINVGVDVWDFEPISISTILKFYNKIMKERKREIENGK